MRPLQHRGDLIGQQPFVSRSLLLACAACFAYVLYFCQVRLFVVGKVARSLDFTETVSVTRSTPALYPCALHACAHSMLAFVGFYRAGLTRASSLLCGSLIGVRCLLLSETGRD